MARRIEIVVNPAAGSQLGYDVVQKHILHLLTDSGFVTNTIGIRQTRSSGDGVRVGQEIISEYLDSDHAEQGGSVQLDIIAVGGDGTTHELLNGLYLSSVSEDKDNVGDRDRKSIRDLRVRLAIVPTGTANALYAAMYTQEWSQKVQHKVATAKTIQNLEQDVVLVMLKSVRSLATSVSTDGSTTNQLHSLPLMLNTFTQGRTNQEKLVISHLVTSHALHARILHDADTPQMRAKYAGIERFKMAAQMNATRWTHGCLTLQPRRRGGGGGGGEVLRYSPESKLFEPLWIDEKSQKEVRLEGPFLYLNAMITDRLESSFIPAPLSSGFTRDGGIPVDAVDMVIIRPKRDPSLSGNEDEEKAGMQFATTRLEEITQGMYSGGTHTDLVYHDQEVMVEYYRCAGYTFVAQKDQEGLGKATLVCTDGFICKADKVHVTRWTRDVPEEARVKGVHKLDPPLVWR
ncbi:uncharacterized protein MEPE_02682 [Melanopsichium pennsylvanicum]|uniref:DAGKc domain-containing protein n=1 Tax=Melanopsichium pennsylvanicum TaxID=63383 RepID=A0AAJ4XKE8_9BASI|nr:uncharacterized protein MEPE_02682 [Melanopsichium pennsylvanicum]